MQITELFKNNQNKKSKRVGRGIAAGQGKTAGRGTKGQKSRTGSNRKTSPWFEGGQTPLHRKMAKVRGFNHKVAKPFLLTTDVIDRHYKSGEIVSPSTLLEKKIVRKTDLKAGIKVVLRSKLTANVEFDSVALSKSLSQLKTPTAVVKDKPTVTKKA